VDTVAEERCALRFPRHCWSLEPAVQALWQSIASSLTLSVLKSWLGVLVTDASLADAACTAMDEALSETGSVRA
jgi:hypothetical protein